MQPDALEPIIADAVAKADFAALFAVEEGVSWVAAAADETALALEWNADARRLVLSADIAPLGEETDAALLRLLLGYNGNWRETGGLRIALDRGDVAQLVLDLPSDTLDASWLAAVLTGFAEALNSWREALASPQAASRPAPAVPESFRIAWRV
ncbi:MAG: type III secretion system chaperone [Pseudomonadota bacterium]